MTSRIGHADARLQRMEQAALWLQRIRDASADNRVVDDWLDWCQRDPLNQQAFDEVAEVWEFAGKLGEATSRIQPDSATALAPRLVRRPPRRALVASLAGLFVAAAAGGWWLRHEVPAAVATVEYSSPVGMNSVHTLADGSVLELGGGTEVTVTLDAHERRVELRTGELFVTVHHDTARPFKVESGMIEVVATGTAFNVLRSDTRTTVTVSEGSVVARYAADSWPLKTGEQLVHPHGTRKLEVRRTNPDKAAEWRTGVLNFDGEPLSEVIARVNRYAGARIAIEDPRAAAEPMTTAVRVDGIDDWLAGIQHPLSVTVTRRADGVRVITPRKAARQQ